MKGNSRGRTSNSKSFQHKPLSQSSLLWPFLALGAMHDFTNFGHSVYDPDPLEGVDIESEYKLIQEKKSGLSARLRRRVCRLYEERHA